jgi:hypothetical protein
MMPRALRRLIQAATALALAGAVILITEWSYPAGHLLVRIGRPYYSRAVGESAAYVTLDVTIKNIGTEPVRIDREHFLLIDDQGKRYSSDPTTHFLRYHFDLLTLPAGDEVQGATVFKILPGRKAALMLFVTPTGQFVPFRLQ